MSELNPRLAAIEREKALFLYSSALKRGDETEIERILQMAAQDAALEEMIFQMHDFEAAQEDQTADDLSAAKVRELLELHMPSALMAEADEEIEELPPVTVAEVVARIQSDVTRHRQVRNLLAEAAQLAERLNDLKIPLPPQVNHQSLEGLFQSLGVSVSSQFQKCFRETALFLNMGRQQSQAQLAATRRQRKVASQPKVTEGDGANEVKEDGS